MNVQNFGRRVVGQQLVADGMHQMGFTQANAAVNEQRVVKLPQAAGDMQCRRASHAVSRPLNQRVESQRRVDSIFESGIWQFLGHRCTGRFWRASTDKAANERIRTRGRLSWGERQLNGNSLAGNLFQQS